MVIRVIYRLLSREILLGAGTVLECRDPLGAGAGLRLNPHHLPEPRRPFIQYSAVSWLVQSSRATIGQDHRRRSGRSQARDWSFMWRLDLKPKSTWLFWIKNGPLSSVSGRPGSSSGSKLFLGMWLVVSVETWSPTKIYLGVLNKKWPIVKSFGRPGSYSRSGRF